jgi:tripartite-type tricarboxylate transporter receptor subunit TctC
MIQNDGDARRWPRRPLLRGTATAILAGATAPLAGPAWPGQAASYPNQTVRFINLFVPGGSTDLLSRAYCARMSDLTGHSFVVENRSGAGGTVGQAAIAQAAPDGYTIGLGSIASLAIAPWIYPSLPYHPQKDFTYIAGLWQVPNLLVCNNDLPVRSLPELVALVRANPGKFLYGSGGSGTSPHLTMEWLKQVAGLDIQHVPYRGGAPALLDMIAGRIQCAFDNIASVMGAVRQGQVRPLAVTSGDPSPVLPEIPTMTRFYPDFEITSWGGVVGPAGMRPAIVERLVELSRSAARHPEFQRVAADNGASVWWAAPEDFAAFQVEQQALFGRLVRTVGASAN